MANWLKALGSAKEQLPEEWTTVQVLEEAVMFARKPMVRMGDNIVYYASGKGVIFARGRVTSHPYRRENTAPEHADWPWYVDVALDARVPLLRNGIDINVLSIGARSVSKSMRRRSHIRLTDDEYGAAVKALT